MKTMLILVIAAAAASFAAFVNLQNLPSAPGGHITQIEALGDNEWLSLGTPTADPTWGVARGRSWGGRALAYAPNYGGAFFCGTGVHAYVKPNGHYMDDLWFYDMNQNKWICLYPGGGTNSSNDPLDLHLGANGFEYNELEEYVPVSYLSHAYGNSTYIPALKRFMVVHCQCPWWCPALIQRAQWLWSIDTCPYYGGVPAPISNTKHPIFYNADSGVWERRFVSDTAGPVLSGSAPTGVTEYIPYLDKVFFASSGRVWLYDYNTNTWEYKGRDPSVPSGHNGCYDSRRKRVYYAQSENFVYYDLTTDAFTVVNGTNQPTSFGSSNNGSLNYDSANDRIIWHTKDANRHPGVIAAFNPETEIWETPQKTIPDLSIPYLHYKGIMGCYSPDLNAHFYYLAGDSDNSDATMVVYRYKIDVNAVSRTGPAVKSNIRIAASPNPFNAAVVISVDDGHVGATRRVAPTLAIYNTHGRMVHRAGNINPGRYTWNATGLSPGLYFVVLESGGQKLIKRVTLLK
jgi:hypothetical protein